VIQLRSRGSARIRYVAKSQDVREGWQYESVPCLAGPPAGELCRYLEQVLTIFEEIQSPTAERVRTWLAELEENE
jgi:hypothetical protein